MENTGLDTIQHNFCKKYDLSEQSWQAAIPFFNQLVYEKDEHLLQAGQQTKQLKLMLSGLVRFYYVTEEGKVFNKTFAGVGSVVSSMVSLIEGKTSPFSVQALQTTQCLCIDYDRFLALEAQFPEWRFLRIKMLEQLVIKKETREADFLLLSAEQRYRKFLVEYSDMVRDIPNYHIASYLGITEVALSRIRKRLGLTQVNDD